MTENLENKVWILKRRPIGAVSSDDMEYISSPVPPIGDNELLIRNIYLSLDPSNRIWMSDTEQYMPPVDIGDVMRGAVIGVVEKSNSKYYEEGDFVSPANAGWETYTVASARSVRPLKPAENVPLTAYASVLGGTGITAYMGLHNIGKPSEGETIVVSAAAGAVGSIVGQMATIRGCRVIGIAGSAQKCNWLTNELGFDGAINYKAGNVEQSLDELCPDGIDISYENVGGDIMAAVYQRMNNFGRIVVCGLISSYNSEGPVAGPGDFNLILMRRLTIAGFIATDYMQQVPEALGELESWVKEGRIQWKTHTVPGLENAVDALNLLYTGGNDGKLLVQISNDPSVA